MHEVKYPKKSPKYTLNQITCYSLTECLKSIYIDCIRFEKRDIQRYFQLDNKLH